jgi:L,D-transpeptidase YcbB
VSTAGNPASEARLRRADKVWRGVAAAIVVSGLALALAAVAVLFGAAPVLADPPAPPPTPARAAPPLGPATLTPFTGNIGIEDRLDPASRLELAGEPLDQHLLRRFYLAHHYHMVWDQHPQQAAQLWNAVRHTADQGLDPALFHSRSLTERWAALSPVDRDLLLSDAFLSYAQALAEGAVPVAERSENEALRPEPVDIVAVLDAAIAAPDPAAVIEALAPSSPEYLEMCRAYRVYAAIAAGESGPGLPRVGIIEARWRAKKLAVNLERLRWLPRHMPADRIVVDTAIARLQLFADDKPIFTTRVVAGETDDQTPELQSVITAVLFNPPWNVPRSIFDKEIRPKLAFDRHYLAEHHMRWRGPGEVQQVAGPYSSLGRLKFEMADRFDVYLHDTPEKWRFGAADRMKSHGCVRVENAVELAGLLLDASPGAIEKGIAPGRTHGRALPKPMPVFLVYRTASVESDGAIVFRADPYQRDNAILAYLDRASQRPQLGAVIASQR